MQYPYKPIDDAITTAIHRAEAEQLYYIAEKCSVRDRAYCAEMAQKWEAVIHGLKATQLLGRALFK
jgi:hypothetical protein